MVEPGQVTAVVPTRGNVDMGPVMAPLWEAGYGEILVYDNSAREDLGIYGRFKGIEEAKFPVVYTQDDDIAFRQHAELLSLYKPGVLVTAYPQPCSGDIPWISTGAVFDRDLPKKAFDKYLQHYPFDEFLTHRAADAVFALLTDSVEVHPMPYEELAWAKDAGRVHTSEGWYDRDRPLAWDRCLAIR